MESRVDESAPRDRASSDEQRVTLSTWSEYAVPEQPQFEAPDNYEKEERLWPKGLLDEVCRTPPPRRWPAIVAVVLAGLAVILADAAVIHFRHLRAANTALAGPPTAAKQSSTTATTHTSTHTTNLSQPAAAVEPAVKPPPGSAEARPMHRVAANSWRTTEGPASPAREQSSWQREAEPERGIPLEQVYVNQGGALVDAQGHPLRLDTAQANDGTPASPAGHLPRKVR